MRTGASFNVTGGQSRFAQDPAVNVPRSVFNRSCRRLMAFDAGFLYPFYVDEALPGDSMRMRLTVFGRMTTPIFPVMDNLYLETFFFFVPNRLIWDNWEKFNGAQDNPGDSTDFTVPQFTAHTVTEESLSDYMGLPIATASNITYNSLHHRAYNLIYNEWYRDQNLQNSLVVDKDDGPDDIADYVLKRRGKRHDYFTSCLPWTQKGAAVTLPLGTSAPVSGSIVGDGSPPTFDSSTQGTSTLSHTTGSDPKNVQVNVGGTSSGTLDWEDPHLILSGATADLSGATASTINDIRLAFQTQKLLERDARGGTRYTELIKSHFGVISPDARLQRPEYLGGGRTHINIHPVASTQEFGTNYLGSLGAFVTFGQDPHGFTKSFTEHGVIIGLVNVRADLSYQQGIDRMFSRQTRYDYYWPSLSMIGEQAVLNKEIYADGSANDDLVFGYQERYGEYRYKPSSVAGAFRSTHSAPLDAWHLAQEFSSLPALNASFIEDNPPVNRVVQVDSEPEFWADFWMDYKCARPMPTYGVPGLIDHF